MDSTRVTEHPTSFERPQSGVAPSDPRGALLPTRTAAALPAQGRAGDTPTPPAAAGQDPAGVSEHAPLGAGHPAEPGGAPDPAGARPGGRCRRAAGGGGAPQRSGPAARPAARRCGGTGTGAVRRGGAPADRPGHGPRRDRRWGCAGPPCPPSPTPILVYLARAAAGRRRAAHRSPACCGCGGPTGLPARAGHRGGGFRPPRPAARRAELDLASVPSCARGAAGQRARRRCCAGCGRPFMDVPGRPCRGAADSLGDTGRLRVVRRTAGVPRPAAGPCARVIGAVLFLRRHRAVRRSRPTTCWSAAAVGHAQPPARQVDHAGARSRPG
ncbi:PPM-type phosphatase domain-containing protein OS=Streptomyces fumanus OX=67302 GN=GCM10018772_41310 PE=4 SV=1 [Streptomyces fumanus]